MSRIDELRKKYPQYKNISDEKLLECDRQYNPKPTYSDTMDDFKARPKGIFSSLFERVGLHSDKKVYEGRKEVAGELFLIEQLHAQIVAAQKNTQTASETVELEILARQAIAENQILVAREASIRRIPYLEYVTVVLKMLELHYLRESKQADMEIELERQRLSLKNALDLGNLKRDREFAHMQQILTEIATIEVEIQEYKSLPLPEQVKKTQIDMREKRLEVLKAQYESRNAG